VSRTGQVQSIRALLLRSVLWGERDRLATLFEPESGVLRARAVAAAETESKLGPLLLPPMLATFTLARGHSPIRILAGIEPEERFTEWRGDSLHIGVAGVILSALESLDAPISTNDQFLNLALGILRNMSKSPLDGLAIFLVQALDILGLLGGESQCILCGKEITQGMAAAPTDLQAFICRECYNRSYGNKEVTAVFIEAEHIALLKHIAELRLDDPKRLALDADSFAFIFSLAEARLSDMLPSTVSALLPLAARIS
jgi:DNA repair protein RecO